MFKMEFRNAGSPGRAADHVRVVRDQLLDLRGLGEDIRAALVEGFRLMLASGTDKDGARLAPLAESTVEQRGHSDAPLRPDGRNPILDSLVVEVARTRGGEVRVSAYFTHEAAKFLAEGTSKMPARDVFHPDDRTMAAVQGIIDDHVSGALEGRLLHRF